MGLLSILSGSVMYPKIFQYPMGAPSKAPHTITTLNVDYGDGILN